METERDHEIEYDRLVDHLIEDFQPARRPWPVNSRLIRVSATRTRTPRPRGIRGATSDLLSKLGSLRYLFALGLLVFIERRARN
jgi:hypothetical protein